MLLLGSAQCSKEIGDGPINVAPSKKTKNKKCEHTHELINMNHTTDYTLKINYLTIVGFLGTEDFFNLLGGNNWFWMG